MKGEAVFDAGSDVVSGITVRFYDLKDPRFEVSPGIYYNIPFDQSQHEAEIRLRGPFPTVDDARAAAKTFIIDADTAMALDVSDEEIDEAELSSDELEVFGARPTTAITDGLPFYAILPAAPVQSEFAFPVDFTEL